ncbi:OsmC family protein [Kangiella sediminilitoris]|uniref:OsmC family protein n=1 Tax=Kangiella sediminilitoris TaxID=1144748 RepID=A0A1B3B7S1_9GAMM|nr:OsmC family protein [Kangiella sediminilitoris]AOE48826.1 OsmC family protein [Kangiella sediminilitoris]
MKVTVDWVNDLNFIGKNSKRQNVMFGGEGDYVSPMENLLMSIGACSSVDVVMILQKARQNITGCHCEVESERADEPPRRFTALKLHFVVRGKELSTKQVKKAVDLSVEKYCSVMHSLDPSMPVKTSFDIVPV